MADRDDSAETPATPAAEPTAPPPDITAEEAALSPPPAPERRSSGGFLGMVLGGIVAAGLGYGAATYMPGLLPGSTTSALTDTLGAQGAELDALKAEVQKLGAAPDQSADLAALKAEVDSKLASLPAPPDMTAALDQLKISLEQSLASLDTRLTALEKRPVGAGGAASSSAIDAFERDLQALRDQIAGLGGQQGGAETEIASAVASAKAELAAAAEETRKATAEAQAAADAVARDAAIGRLRAALETGGPFAAPASDLAAAGIILPEPLQAAAPTGIPTLDDLQDSFPPAARAGLAAALRADMGDTWIDRATSFLRDQTGARSTVPREGTDPDAILSRAEAALARGDVPASLAEIATLPEPAQTAMADWVSAARQRVDALAAADGLASQ